MAILTLKMPVRATAAVGGMITEINGLYSVLKDILFLNILTDSATQGHRAFMNYNLDRLGEE